MKEIISNLIVKPVLTIDLPVRFLIFQIVIIALTIIVIVV